eukprot:scaffold74594_cov37-Attheya_sp.AAC.5
MATPFRHPSPPMIATFPPIGPIRAGVQLMRLSGVGATNDDTDNGHGDLHQGPGPGTTERAQLSYVMDFSTEAEIQEDAMVDEYTTDNIKCVVDAKSMLYLYGLELDY